jgi:formate dehydrogenase alpha subunit
MTNSIREIPDTDAFMIIGSNTTDNHPVIGSMIKNQVINKGKKLVVIDPRKIDLAKYADVFLQIKPGTNIAILNGLMHVILKEELYDKEYVKERCEGFDDIPKTMEKYTPEYVAGICGIKDPQLIVKAARLLAAAKPMALYYCMGITQFKSGVNGVKSCSNLQMLLGNIGVKGGGVNPLRGQNNVQGACDMGALNAVYPAYQPVTSEENKAKFMKMWDSKVDMSLKPGLTIVESLNAAIAGDLKGLYVFGENPVMSDPNQHHVIEALEDLDFVVVQDIVMTETAQYADVVLPGYAFLEKEGTASNTERRVQPMHRVVKAHENCREDWWIIMQIANRMGANWDYKNAEEIFEEIRKVTPSYAGITYDRLEKELIQWPCPNEDHKGTQFLHKDKFSRGLGLFTAIEYTAPAEDVDPEYPMILTTGRLLEHFHTGTMTRNSKVLDEIVPGAFLEINPNDASNFNIKDGEVISVSTRRGSVRMAAKISDKPMANVIFMPFHFFEAAANKLTIDALDPTCKIPEFKVCACKIEKISM